MDYRHKRDALIAYESIMPDGLAKTELTAINKDIDRLVKIREIAAHGLWVKGRKRGSIKPLSFRARGPIRIRGHTDNEPNYSASSLESGALEMRDLHGRLLSFLHKAGRDPFADVRKPRTRKIRSTSIRTSSSKAANPSHSS
jgi:hypothetical protein